MKEKIFAERSDFVVDRQKLIHSGKVLKDTSTVEEIGIKESEFLVCMVTKEVAKVYKFIRFILIYDAVILIVIYSLLPLVLHLLPPQPLRLPLPT